MSGLIFRIVLTKSSVLGMRRFGRFRLFRAGKRKILVDFGADAIHVFLSVIKEVL